VRNTLLPGPEPVQTLFEPQGGGGGVAHARVNVPVNRETCPLLDERLERLLGNGAHALVADLGPAEYLDSDGVRWLQRLQARLEERRIELRLAVREGSRVERTVRLLQMARTFAIDFYPSDLPAPRAAVGR